MRKFLPILSVLMLVSMLVVPIASAAPLVPLKMAPLVQVTVHLTDPSRGSITLQSGTGLNTRWKTYSYTSAPAGQTKLVPLEGPWIVNAYCDILVFADGVLVGKSWWPDKGYTSNKAEIPLGVKEIWVFEQVTPNPPVSGTGVPILPTGLNEVKMAILDSTVVVVLEAGDHRPTYDCRPDGQTHVVLEAGPFVFNGSNTHDKNLWVLGPGLELLGASWLPNKDFTEFRVEDVPGGNFYWVLEQRVPPHIPQH